MPVAAEPVLRGWWARLLDVEEPGAPRQQTLVGVVTDEFPPGTLVTLPGTRRPAGWRVLVRADVDGGGVHSVQVAQPGVPLLWYVEVPEPGARPAATTLVAYSDDR